jgi:hypothetical protein
MDLLAPYSNYLLAGLIVLAVLILVVMVVKAVGGRVRGRRGSRLGVSEYHEIDKMRRLVLVRRDDVEHLLMIGGERDVVIETRIGAPAAAEEPVPARRLPREATIRPVPDLREAEEERPAPRPAPRPAVFGDRPPVLRPVGREEPRLATTRPAGEDEHP